MVSVRELQASINTRHALIDDAKTNLKDNKIATILLFIEMQDKEMPCVRDLLVKIDEVVVWPAMDGDKGGVVITARWGTGCGVEGGGDVVMVLEVVAAAARVGTEVVGGAWWRVA
nr:hypothetical protein [Tanacetum cinerariifolium]